VLRIHPRFYIYNWLPKMQNVDSALVIEGSKHDKYNECVWQEIRGDVLGTVQLRPRLGSSSEGSESLALDTDLDRSLRRLLGTRRFRARFREDCESDPLESESDPDEESESSEPELESESDSEPEFRLARLLGRSLPLPFSRSFSFASSIRFAVPGLLVNSSGTSTEGLPSSLSFASTPGFSSCCVREGRVTYGRVALHS